jgi:hypothetical protein
MRSKASYRVLDQNEPGTVYGNSGEGNTSTETGFGVD